MKPDYLDHLLGSCAVALSAMLIVLVPLARADSGEDPCSNPEYAAVCAAAGMICYEGQCITNPCGVGEMFVNGECLEDPCYGIQCSGGQVCQGGECVDPPASRSPPCTGTCERSEDIMCKHPDHPCSGPDGCHCVENPNGCDCAK